MKMGTGAGTRTCARAIDPILSILVVLLILRAALQVVRDSGHILLEGVPPGFDCDAVARDLRDEIAALTEVRHLHAWSISQERPTVTLEAVLAPGSDADEARQRIKDRLRTRFDIDHATVEHGRARV